METEGVGLFVRPSLWTSFCQKLSPKNLKPFIWPHVSLLEGLRAPRTQHIRNLSPASPYSTIPNRSYHRPVPFIFATNRLPPWVTLTSSLHSAPNIPQFLSTLLLNGCPVCPSRLSLTWSSSCSPCPGVLVLGVCPLIILSGAPGYCHKSKCHKKEPSPTVYNVKDENTLARHLQFNSTLCSWTSLLVQWLRVCLLKQGTWVWSLVQEDSTCCGATKPMHHNHWACALEPRHRNKISHHSEKPTHLNQRGAPARSR